MLSTLVLASSLLGYVSASSSITWLKPSHSAIVKLDTPGYPLWLMDKAHAPILQSQSEDFYWEQNKSSALLVNLTMSPDFKTLLLNHEAILPMANGNTPPLLHAYQVPAEVTEARIRNIADYGLLNRQWEDLTMATRFLALDYDRLVWADPEAGPYSNHEPTLRFRILGLGAHSRSDALDSEQQTVLLVTLTEVNGRSSDDPDRSYRIARVELKNVEDGYAHAYAPSVEPRQDECTLRSWKCPDKGLYWTSGKPAYRFMWRSHFDNHGRIGSLRHAIFKKVHVLARFWEDAGPAMTMSFGILIGPILMVMLSLAMYRRFAKERSDRIRLSDAAFDDGIFGEEGFGEKYVDAPPLPPRPVNKDAGLVDL
ncbi:hypothetical protein K504DRAFT_460026 [Pleomassaria siparia CBS 279.74]|uniref:Uncharacterized protein n=1 Tax=Pleomassaria siparia CBS 279.74 TaxID=1314801 RepID=A0A6G1JZA7_9PLEO|nr:hypothetical protein K504DRAFT_460026 [Pleomassaria siparia CBS 279.74]